MAFLLVSISSFITFARRIQYSFTVFWGAAIVLFLSKIINLHDPDTQGFWIEISAQVETGELSALKAEVFA